MSEFIWGAVIAFVLTMSFTAPDRLRQLMELVEAVGYLAVFVVGIGLPLFCIAYLVWGFATADRFTP